MPMVSRKNNRSRFTAAVLLLVAIWGVSILVLVGGLGAMPALVPRTWDGLWGILTMPFLHANLYHLLANSAPLLAFSVLISIRGSGYFIRVTLIILLLGGAMLWLLGRSAMHIGASLLVFGYFGFLLTRVFYERSLMNALITFLVALFYGGMIWGIVPQGQQISWEGHLFGLLSGGLAAKILRPRTSAG